MAEEFFIFLLLMIALAIIFKEDMAFTMVYIFAGAYILGGWWMRQTVKSITFKRTFSTHIFYGEEAPVQLEVTNNSWLPVVWMRLDESLPVTLRMQKSFQRVLTLGPHSKAHYEYTLVARKRGYYPIGPSFTHMGDLLGLLGEQAGMGKASHITVYPEIIPLKHMRLPSSSPMGTLRHNQPIFEDPSRVLSKRDYTAGDSLRRVDWKSSAAVGRLQVKQFEPSIALETSIFLNLNPSDYDLKARFDAADLAITVAASIASWVIGQKQSVGLVTNGVDPYVEEEINLAGQTPDLTVSKAEKAPAPQIKPLPPRKGRSHLMHILEALARVEARQGTPVADLLRKEYTSLSWGTTVILITGQTGEDLFDVLFQVRRAGLNVMLILVGKVANYREIQQRAHYFKFPVYNIANERDMVQLGLYDR